MIRINEGTFPILACMNDNIMSDAIQVMLEDSGFDDKCVASIQESFVFFQEKQVNVNFLSSAAHKKLLKTNNFIHAKSMLKDSVERTGLLLLPETIYPDFTNVPSYADADADDYPINAILYSWLSMDRHDQLAGTFDADEPWRNPEERTLLIIPNCNDRITQATDQFHMVSNDEIYGWDYSESEGRAWYGKIHDYVMSYLILDRMRSEASIPDDYKTINYQMEYVDNPYGNAVKILDLLHS
jgi:hypothetical protein